jgi:hypothetical protein
MRELADQRRLGHYRKEEQMTTPKVMPQEFEPRGKGRNVNPSWALAQENPGRWILSTLSSTPNVAVRNSKLANGRFRVATSGRDGGKLEIFIRFEPDADGES